MKNYDDLFMSVTNFENLLKSFYKARQNKRLKRPVMKYYYNLENNIISLKNSLENGDYFPDKYRIFYVKEHKKRLIAAASFKDRVVHHAILNVLEPIYERSFIYDSYGCRRNKGQHKAMKRFQDFSRKNKFVLKLDIGKFYASIDHEILMNIIKKKIVDTKLIYLIQKIVDSGKGLSDSETPIFWFYGDDLFTPITRFKGLPIGNVTSQFFANVFLNELDWFIKQKCRCKYYIRYMDDMAIFSDDKQFLWSILEKIKSKLYDLRLILNKSVTNLHPVKEGTEFLGFRIYPTHIKVRKATVYRYVRKTDKKIKKLIAGDFSYDKLKQSYVAWKGHIEHANGFNLKRMVAIRLINNNMSIKSELLKKCFDDI